jgi:hypothetical protein
MLPLYTGELKIVLDEMLTTVNKDLRVAADIGSHLE